MAPKYDLEERLLAFSARIMILSEALPKTRSGNHVAGQILRSGTSAYPNHGEAQAAESSKDFIHKMRVCLKELRETLRWLNLIEKANLLKDTSLLCDLRQENDELIRIFVKSIQTASSK
ncbi:MAG: four helix bundle protein [Verrucomicrobia bacterium]|nr:four helix bundle protein [Verrucomicrobiota bacterium]